MIQFIDTFFVPRLKVVMFSPVGILKILIKVPLSDAVANKVPFLFTDIQASVDSCAFNNFESFIFFLLIQFLKHTIP